MVLFLMVSSHQVTILPPPKKVTILKRAKIMPVVLCLKHLPASFLVLVPLYLFATTLRDIAVVCCCCFNVLFLFCEFR